MTNLSTTAWVLHDLGLAAGFGGNLFGQMALNPAVKTIGSPHDRSRVTNAAWRRFRAINAISHIGVLVTWLAGRSMLSGREAGPQARGLVLAKDFMLGGVMVTGVAGMITGGMLARMGAVPVESGTEPSPETPERVARLQRVTRTVGVLNILCSAGVMALTTILAMQSGRSTRWKVTSRHLP